MIHYRVWLSFASDVPADAELARIRAFLTDLRSRQLIADFMLLRRRGEPGPNRVSDYETAIVYADDEQLSRSMAHVIVDAGGGRSA